ncbi:MAG: SpoIID/LytB domain-containing protein, partial [Actinomycetota bacterium]|nr:SpoIID/LytB domain-containing protein [Actinomycetota bacterium]
MLTALVAATRLHTMLPAALAGAVLFATVAAPSAPAAAAGEVYPRPASGGWVLDGLGHGHGRGMSQWGAYGGAKLGKTAAEILAAYYPGTTNAQTSVPTLRVRLTVDDGLLEVAPDVPGKLAAATPGGTPAVLPGELGGCAVDRWRASRVTGGLQLEGRACGSWSVHPIGGATAVPAPLSFSTTAGRVRVVLGSGSGQFLRDYRGSVGAVVDPGGSYLTVNRVSMEDYLRSVVAWEMSPSWHLEALKAQAVAARTYASWDAASPSSGYDTCDSTSCQAYRGTADHRLDGTRTASHEWAASDAAVAATAGTILTYAGKPAFTQFSAANGGRSAAHPDEVNYPYLPERDDPWDGVIPNSGHSWRTTITPAAVEQAWPGVGTVRALRVLSRTGSGAWGGRITSVAVEGSAGTVTVSGDAFRFRLGLKSSWWRGPAAPAAAPSAPQSLAATAADGVVTVTWEPPASSGSGPVTGYAVTVGSARVTTIDTSLTLPPLPPGTYAVSVTASNSAGASPAATATAAVPAYPSLIAPRGVNSGTAATLTLAGLVPGAGTRVQVLPYGATTWAAG